MTANSFMHNHKLQVNEYAKRRKLQ